MSAVTRFASLPQDRQLDAIDAMSASEAAEMRPAFERWAAKYCVPDDQPVVAGILEALRWQQDERGSHPSNQVPALRKRLSNRFLAFLIACRERDAVRDLSANQIAWLDREFLEWSRLHEAPWPPTERCKLFEPPWPPPDGYMDDLLAWLDHHLSQPVPSLKGACHD